MKKSVKKSTNVNQCWNTRGVWSNADEKCELLADHIHCRNCPVFSVEGKRVLDRVPPVGYLKDWRKTLAAKDSERKVGDQAILVFRVNDEWFALPSSCLQEITEKKTIHRIPRNRNSGISGVVNIGGEVRVCYSLENILDVKSLSSVERENDAVSSDRFVVCQFNGRHYVFFVNQIIGMSWYNENDICSSPSTLERERGSMLSGVINQNNINIALIDSDVFQENLEGVHL